MDKNRFFKITSFTQRLFVGLFFVFATQIAHGQQVSSERFYQSIENQFYLFKFPEEYLQKTIAESDSVELKQLLSNILSYKNQSLKNEAGYVKLTQSFLSYYEIGNDFKEYGLTDLELLAIRLYTGEDYKTINSALRSKQVSRGVIQYYVQTLDSALSKLPDYKGVVLRGSNLPVAVEKDYVEGNIVSDLAYMSTSKTIKYNGKYQFKIHSQSGKYVDAISHNKGEEEVLFARNTKFKILKVEAKSDQEVHVEMIEIKE